MLVLNVVLIIFHTLINSLKNLQEKVLLNIEVN